MAPETITVLEYATKVTGEYSLIDFVYTDININLKICLKEGANQKPGGL